MSKEMFKGVFTVVPTPLMKDEGVDSAGLHHLIDYYIDSGCHGLLVLGSGGEFPYFTYEERLKIASDAAAAVKGRVPLVVGVGFCSTIETMQFMSDAGSLMIDGFLVITPTFYPLAFDDVYGFYAQLCTESKKPVLYYNFPQMTGLFFSPEQIARLLSIEGIVGMKESILNISEIKQHINLTDDRNVAVFSGNCFCLKQVLDIGGSGAIGIIPSVAPHLVVDCYNACIEKDLPKALNFQKKILDLLPLLNNFGLPVGIQKTGFKVISSLPIPMKKKAVSKAAVIKETLHQLGHPITSKVRSPQTGITKIEKDEIKKLIRKNNLSA